MTVFCENCTIMLFTEHNFHHFLKIHTLGFDQFSPNLKRLSC